MGCVALTLVVKWNSLIVKRVSYEEVRESFEGVECKDKSWYNEQTNAYLSLSGVQFNSVLLSPLFFPVMIVTQNRSTYEPKEWNAHKFKTRIYRLNWQYLSPRASMRKEMNRTSTAAPAPM